MTGLNQRNIVLTPWCKRRECEKEVHEKSKNEAIKTESGDEVLTG